MNMDNTDNIEADHLHEIVNDGDYEALLAWIENRRPLVFSEPLDSRCGRMDRILLGFEGPSKCPRLAFQPQGSRQGTCRSHECTTPPLLDSFLNELDGIGKPLIGAIKATIPHRPDMEKLLVEKALHYQTTIVLRVAPRH